jgi:hypothetical protein
MEWLEEKKKWKESNKREGRRKQRYTPRYTILLPLINQTFLINNDDDCLLHPTTTSLLHYILFIFLNFFFSLLSLLFSLSTLFTFHWLISTRLGFFSHPPSAVGPTSRRYQVPHLKGRY